MLLDILERHHFTCYKPYGAYYIMTDIGAFGFADDVEFARYLVKEVGVAAVPGSSFYRERRAGPHEAAVLLLQAGRDARRSGPAPGETDAKSREQISDAGQMTRPLALAPSSNARLRVLGIKRRQYLATTPKYSPFSVERSGVLLHEVADVERAVADLRAEVVGDVDGAVDVEVGVVRAVCRPSGCPGS